MANGLTLPFQATVNEPVNGFAITVDKGLPVAPGQTFSAITGTNGGVVIPGPPGLPTGIPIGVSGEADAGIGVQGISSASIGVRGQSTSFDAVVGETASNAHAGVTGRNTAAGANGGVGIYGVGGMYAGKFDGAVQINGRTEIVGGNGQGVVATSGGADAVVGVTTAAGHAGVIGRSNSGQSYGIWGVGGLAGRFDGAVQVNGTISVTGDVILANSDCAEDFDVALSAEFEAGTVMVLDDHGLLQESCHSYDRKVAGVISGAGELKPGLILGRDHASRDGRRAPVGLVGKVYCKVDAMHVAIRVGDLLTTSTTRGHAMKAEDPARAFGAIIGKALQPLKSGRGLIPILIALQ